MNFILKNKLFLEIFGGFEGCGEGRGGVDEVTGGDFDAAFQSWVEVSKVDEKSVVFLTIETN